MTYEDLILLLTTFYHESHVPLFLLDQHFQILKQSEAFVPLPCDFFVDMNLVKESKYFIQIKFLKNELYVQFFLDSNQSPAVYLIAGPYLTYWKKHDSNLNDLFFFHHHTFQEPQKILKQLPRLDERMFPQICLLYGLLYHRLFTMEDLRRHLKQPHKIKYDDTLERVIHEKRTDTTKEYTYQDELLLIHHIQQGDSLSARAQAIKIASGRIGKMSEDQTRQNKYAIISSIAIITRNVIQTGVRIELAYALSDVYISKVDEEYDSRKLYDLYLNAVWDFCELVKKYRYQGFPLWIRQCMEYINDHIYESIHLEELAELVHMAPAYVSVQFKKICGSSLKTYINQQKVKEAQFLLKTTQQSIQEIAFSLNFSTPSHFAKVFQEYSGELPHQYRIHH